MNSPVKARISSIDVVRGIVMVIMTLDHVRDYWHVPAQVFDPTDLTQTTPVLFITRWITHFCAPTFMLLSGASIAISRGRKTVDELAFFLLTRGLWFLAVEVIFMRFGFFFNFTFDMTFFLIFWVAGMSFIIMAGLIYLSEKTILILGIILLVGHNLLLLVNPEPGRVLSAVWTFFVTRGFLEITKGHAVIVGYPVLPWLSVVMIGYSLGRLYRTEVEQERRLKILRYVGFGAIVLFFVLRGINLFDDPSRWAPQKDFATTVMSFFNVTKYPPSFLYLCITLGPSLIVLSYVEKIKNGLTEVLSVYGRVPMVYFLLHFYVIHLGALIHGSIKTGKSIFEMDTSFPATLGGIIPEYGVNLFWVYVVWLSVVVILYPFCKWYDRYKQTHKHWWLSYW